MSAELDLRIKALLEEGRHGEAADLCLAAGHPARAAELYAAVWKWEQAIAVTEQHGLLDLAYQHAIGGQDRDAAGRLLMQLEERPELAVRAAAFAEDKGMLLDAARLRAAAGETAAAAELYERGGELRDAARCYLELGEQRKAGMLLEKRLREDPEDATSGLELGRILAQFGRWDHAVRALQRAAESDEHRAGALKLMIACFSAMGMDEAAGSRLDALRQYEPELPVTVPDMLAEVYGDERGVAGLVGQKDSERLLAGRYRVMRPLGAGATGRVLLAHDAFHEREVAVKVLNVGGGAAGRDAFVRFGREARVAAGISHPNVVKVFEFNPDGPFLVMEFMAGGTLEERILTPNEEPMAMEPTQVWAMAKGVLAALEAVHRRGVVHRDLKPANVFYDAGGNVKLGDFGVAHLTDLGATLTGALVGTLAYMSPEQITGSKRPDASTDLYAMGIILYRCLTGRLPYPGPDFVTQHLEDTAPPPSEVAPYLGEHFDLLIETLLAKEPDERLDSANELLDALRPIPWGKFELPDAPAVETVKTPSIVPDPDEPAAARFEIVKEHLDGSALARDELLEREVELVGIDAAGAERLRAFARADGPYLQAVYGIDDALGRAVLERPRGVLLSNLPDGDPRRASAVADIRLALKRLHEVGVSHGSVDGAHIVVGQARACLRLTLEADPHHPERDWQALDMLGGRGER